MHTVPAGYLRAWADLSAPREKPHLWQFAREATQAKLISVRDAAVRRDIYTLRTDSGIADTTIETDLLSPLIEDPFPNVVQLLASGGRPDGAQWRTVFRFMAFQVARTPRMFQVLRDEGARQGTNIGCNYPQLAMACQSPFLERWLCGMDWILATDRSTLPLFTSDNPVVMLAARGAGAELGVGFKEPGLEIVIPLSPGMCLTGEQTEVSLNAVLGDVPEFPPEFSESYSLRIDWGWLAIEQAVRVNQLTASNADRYVYTSSNDERVRLFLDEHFAGLAGPARRFDGKPIGSPVD
jgi:hypothetical protein